LIEYTDLLVNNYHKFRDLVIINLVTNGNDVSWRNNRLQADFSKSDYSTKHNSWGWQPVMINSSKT